MTTLPDLATAALGPQANVSIVLAAEGYLARADSLKGRVEVCTSDESSARAALAAALSTLAVARRVRG